MAKDEKKPSEIEIEHAKYTEFYNKAYFKFDNITDELDFKGVLSALIMSQESYSSRGRDIRNIFFTNSFNKKNLIHFDNGLPETIKLWQYYTILDMPKEEYFEKGEIFKNKDELKAFYISFMNRFFKSGVEEYSFFDKMVFNTLIKSKIIIRYDSAYEDFNITAKAFFTSANN